MKKLYQVEITVFVMADDKDEAASIASVEAQPEDCEVWEARSVQSEWWDAIPYGADDDMKCGEILKQQRAAQHGHEPDAASALEVAGSGK